MLVIPISTYSAHSDGNHITIFQIKISIVLYSGVSKELGKLSPYYFKTKCLIISRLCQINLEHNLAKQVCCELYTEEGKLTVFYQLTSCLSSCVNNCFKGHLLLNYRVDFGQTLQEQSLYGRP